MLTTNQNKILITGASGYLCKYFYDRGYFVIAQTRNTNNEELKSISNKQVLLEDIFDFEIDT